MHIEGARWTILVDLNLQQNGNRVTGTMRSRFQDARGQTTSDDTDRVSGTIQGNQLTIMHDGDRLVFTLSPDQQTLTTTAEGQRYTLRRQNR